MLGNFIYHNPTKVIFGENALSYLEDELKPFGKNIMLVSGTGSIKKNGIYDRVVTILRSCGKNIIEDPGVMPNPTLDKLMDGISIARENDVDFILAVGGGSVCDYAKAVAISVNCREDPWEKYFVRFENPDCEVLPVGCVLTMVGTGSEMNAGAVITNNATKMKITHVFGSDVMPKFAILNPRFTFSVPRRQMVAGIITIING